MITLFISGLPFNISSEQLSNRFSQAAEVPAGQLDVHLPFNRALEKRSTMTSVPSHADAQNKGFGFIALNERDKAAKLVKMFNNTRWGGKKLVIQPVDKKNKKADTELKFRLEMNKKLKQQKKLERQAAEKAALVNRKHLRIRKLSSRVKSKFITLKSVNQRKFNLKCLHEADDLVEKAEEDSTAMDEQEFEIVHKKSPADQEMQLSTLEENENAVLTKAAEDRDESFENQEMQLVEELSTNHESTLEENENAVLRKPASDMQESQVSSENKEVIDGTPEAISEENIGIEIRMTVDKIKQDAVTSKLMWTKYLTKMNLLKKNNKTQASTQMDDVPQMNNFTWTSRSDAEIEGVQTPLHDVELNERSFLVGQK